MHTNKNGHNILQPLSKVPENIRQIKAPYLRLRDAPLSKLDREVRYRLNALQDVFLETSHLQRKQYSKNKLCNIYHFFNQFMLAIIGGFSSNDYFAYGGTDFTSFKDIVRSYIGYFRRWEFRERLNDNFQSNLLWNKILTLRILEHNGLPCSRMRANLFQNKYYLVKDNIVISELDNLANNLGDGEFIFKPACKRWGESVGFASVNRKIQKFQINDNLVSIIDFQNFFIDLSKHEPFLIEEQLYNHKEIKKLSKKSLNTVRVMTCKSKTDSIVPFAAALRYSNSDSIIDNWSAGGFASPIDINTGRVGTPFKKGTKIHPDLKRQKTTKYPIIMIIPFWNDILDISVKAHKIFSKMRSIGWDIAITEDGPVIVEGNDDWDIILPQTIMQTGLWKTDFRKSIF